eukprot:g60288.t1
MSHWCHTCRRTVNPVQETCPLCNDYFIEEIAGGDSPEDFIMLNSGPEQSSSAESKFTSSSGQTQQTSNTSGSTSGQTIGNQHAGQAPAFPGTIQYAVFNSPNGSDQGTWSFSSSSIPSSTSMTSASSPSAAASSVSSAASSSSESSSSASSPQASQASLPSQPPPPNPPNPPPPQMPQFMQQLLQSFVPGAPPQAAPQDQQPALPPFVQQILQSLGQGGFPFGGPAGFDGGGPGGFPAAFFNGVPLRGNLGDYGFGNMGDLIAQLMANDPNRHGPPPASAEAVSALPETKVDEELLSSGKLHDCAVCKDEFQLDEEALRMPCMHIFHKDCLLPWLKLHNTCPVCRYELPTDDPFWEQRRRNMRSQQAAAGPSQQRLTVPSPSPISSATSSSSQSSAAPSSSPSVASPAPSAFPAPSPAAPNPWAQFTGEGDNSTQDGQVEDATNTPEVPPDENPWRDL